MNERPAAPRPMMEKSAVGLFFMYAIKYPAKQAAHLKAVHEKERHALSVFAGLVEEKVLQILCFLHDKSSLSPGSPAL